MSTVTSWTCRSCGAHMIGPKTEDGFCGQCHNMATLDVARLDQIRVHRSGDQFTMSCKLCDQPIERIRELDLGTLVWRALRHRFHDCPKRPEAAAS